MGRNGDSERSTNFLNQKYTQLLREKTATKPFEKGFRIFDAKKVLRPSVYINKPGSLECIIRATVLPSQRNDTQYKTAVAVNRTNGTVLAATCSCIAGKCSACNHMHSCFNVCH